MDKTLDYTTSTNPTIEALNKARATLVASGANPYTGVQNTPLGSNILGSITAPLVLPTPTPLPTTGVATTTKNLSSAEQAMANLTTQEQAYKDQAKTTAETSKSKVGELFGLQNKAYEEKLAAYQTPEFTALKELTTKALNDQITLRKAQDAETKAITDNSQMTAGGKQQALNDLNNKYAFQSAQLSLTSSIAGNNYSEAKLAIDDMYTLTMEKYTPQINYYSQLAQNDQEIFTKNEQQILANKRDEYKTLQQTEADNVKLNGEAMQRYNQFGANITTKDSPGQRAQKIASVGGEGVYQTPLEKAQIANIYSQIAERNNPTGGGGVVTLTGKPQNASQSSANGYADRLNMSNIVIDDIGGKFTGTFDVGGSMPNFLQSGERQSYEQAKRNFITAVLRRESGAAISPSEFDTEALKYFPQAGDKPETVIQKSNARNTAINNVYREANVSRPVLPGMIIESNGVKYRVASDGETLEKI